MAQENRNVVLALRHVDVKFNVRGRTLNAIRDVTLNIFEGESLAIVGESGSGKSVLTKTFAGMLDSNGKVSHGTIIFNDDETSRTFVKFTKTNKKIYEKALAEINNLSYLEKGVEVFSKITKLKEEYKTHFEYSPEEIELYEKKLKEFDFKIIDLTNDLMIIGKSEEEKALKEEKKVALKNTKNELKAFEKQHVIDLKNRKKAGKADVELTNTYKTKLEELEKEYATIIDIAKTEGLTKDQEERNETYAKEVVLSVGRFAFFLRQRLVRKILKGFKSAFESGVNLNRIKKINAVFDCCSYRVEYKRTFQDIFESLHTGPSDLIDEKDVGIYNRCVAAFEKEFKKLGKNEEEYSEKVSDLCKRIAHFIGRDAEAGYKYEKKIRKHVCEMIKNGKDINDVTVELSGVTMEGFAIIDCAKITHSKDWQRIRGKKIATVFQDPMTSLNPIVTIGKQIMTVIIKHQRCSEIEAKRRAIDIMDKVGIPDPASRFNDYPFQYSGGMRQRIVIAIALSCQPKILICDEPTTALDVTIQAQIIRLIKSLGKELGFTTVYITHDLGVVANVADRVAVLYAGQIVEIGTVEEIFYDPRHPYTWALLSSMPQLATRGSELFSISGTPPSLYNKIRGDAFAQRSNYSMAIDFVKEPPMFEITKTHSAKTWLLDPRAPKIEKPEIIRNLHEKMAKVYKEEGGKK